jgi:adenylate kinase
MIIVVMGPPAAGKGTQCKLLAERLELPHISTGVLLRDAVSNGSPLGKIAQPYLDRGELVPDETMSALVQERLRQPDAERGAILDGFPRTVDQAQSLNAILGDLGRKVDAAIDLRIPTEVVLERVAYRFACPNCGATYNVRTSPTRLPSVCDNCGSTLEQRDDDKPEVVRRRLEVYEAQTEPLIDFYRKLNVLVELDGDQTVERVLKNELDAIGQLNASLQPAELESKPRGY